MGQCDIWLMEGEGREGGKRKDVEGQRDAHRGDMMEGGGDDITVTL